MGRGSHARNGRSVILITADSAPQEFAVVRFCRLSDILQETSREHVLSPNPGPPSRSVFLNPFSNIQVLLLKLRGLRSGKTEGPCDAIRGRAEFAKPLFEVTGIERV